MEFLKKSAVAVLFVIAIFVIAVLWFSPSFIKDGISAFKDNEIATQESQEFRIIVPDSEASNNVREKISFETVDEAKEYIKAYAEEKGYDFNDYPVKLFELAVKDEQAIDFILNYPEEINKEHSFEPVEPADDNIPVFIQWDKRWGYHQFKNGVVGLDGCGATCLSMAVVYLKGDVRFTPDVVADFVANNGYFVNGSGTSWDLFSKGIKEFGLKSKGIGTNEASLINAVEQKHPVIVSVRAGDFTKKGHYILIAGYENGEFIVNDPFSIVNSEKTWSWERLKPQIKTMWEIYV